MEAFGYSENIGYEKGLRNIAYCMAAYGVCIAHGRLGRMSVADYARGIKLNCIPI